MSETEDSWERTRQKVLARDNNECRFCGTSDSEHREENSNGLDVHHVIPRKHGGQDNVQNLVALCRSCHRTMESLHGNAMEEVLEERDHTEDLEGVNKVWADRQETLDILSAEMHEFVKDHPTFADGFNIQNEPSIQVYGLASPNEYLTDREIGSEWEFIMAYGYYEGMMDVVAGLDGWTGVPFDTEGQ